VIAAFVEAPLDLVFIAIVRNLTRKQVSDLTFGDAALAPA
jgi:hypothetical protein